MMSRRMVHLEDKVAGLRRSSTDEEKGSITVACITPQKEQKLQWKSVGRGQNGCNNLFCGCSLETPWRSSWCKPPRTRSCARS